MGQRTTATRAAALRKAREAKAAQDAERLRREAEIEQALADFYEAAGRAAQIRHAAQQRADKAIADAEQHARQVDAEAGRAVRRLRTLGQTNAQIAQLCQISVAAVRSMANDPGDSPDAGNGPAGRDMAMSATAGLRVGAGDDGGGRDDAAPVTRI